MYKTYASALDEILEKLIPKEMDPKPENRFGIHRSEFSLLEKKYCIDGFEIDQMLEKLIVDGYVSRKDDKHGLYFILFKGMDLIKEGGFVRVRDIEGRDYRRKKIVDYLLGIGAIAASIYYFLHLCD